MDHMRKEGLLRGIACPDSGSEVLPVSLGLQKGDQGLVTRGSVGDLGAGPCVCHLCLPHLKLSRSIGPQSQGAGERA